jgi:hypothetical protein
MSGESTSAQSTSPDSAGALADERDFLLRSLDDLEAERLAGNIDPRTYRVLHDDYTARASAVIKSIEAGDVRDPADAPRVPRVMRVLTIGGIVVFAIVAAILLTRAVGQRQPGQEITGDAQAGGASATTVPIATQVAQAKAAAAAAPKSYDARIRYARTLMTVAPVDAINEFIVASQLDPTQPEPYAYTGWLTAIESRNAAQNQQAQLLSLALGSLDKAIKVDPTYPDSYVFKGLVLTQLENKQCEGATAFQQFLVTAPEDHPMRQQVLGALADAMRTGHCPSPSTPTTRP